MMSSQTSLLPKVPQSNASTQSASALKGSRKKLARGKKHKQLSTQRVASTANASKSKASASRSVNQEAFVALPRQERPAMLPEYVLNKLSPKESSKYMVEMGHGLGLHTTDDAMRFWHGGTHVATVSDATCTNHEHDEKLTLPIPSTSIGKHG